MSDFVCEHGTSYALFGSGGGARLAADVGVPLIGQIPLHPSVAAGGDAGTPVALDEGSPLAEVFDAIAESVITIAPVVPMDGCSVRLLERVEAAVEAGAPLTARLPDGEARRPLRRIRSSGPQAWPGQFGQRGVDLRSRRHAVGHGLLVAGITRPQDEDVTVLDEHDRQHRGDVGDLTGPGHRPRRRT